MGFFSNLFKKNKEQIKHDMPSDNELAKSITDFNNRKIYKKLDIDTLKSIPDAEIIQAIYDYIVEEVMHHDWEHEYEKVKTLPIGFQYIYAIWLLETEVNNGGFNQYFYNSSRQFVDEAYQGCIAIGAKRTANIIDKAVKIFMAEKDMQLEMRKKGTIEAFSESYTVSKLGECDKKFYEYKDDLSALQITYIRKNDKSFTA